jgi:ribosomal protein S18 acetylase RimI-like enzyme
MINESDIVVRGIRQTDIPQIKQLQDILFPIKYKERFYQRLLYRNHHCILVFNSAQSELLGVATAKQIQDDFNRVCCSILKRKFVKRAYLMTFGVTPHARQRGLGTFVLSKIEEELNSKKFDVLSLHVKTDNIPAINFYKKNGFFIVKELTDYYEIDEEHYNAYIMKKRLANYTKRFGDPAQIVDEEKNEKISRGKSDPVVAASLFLLFVFIIGFIIYHLMKES